MIDIKNNAAEQLNEEQLEQVSGGASENTTMCHCSNCGKYPVFPGVYTSEFTAKCPACKKVATLTPAFVKGVAHN